MVIACRYCHTAFRFIDYPDGCPQCRHKAMSALILEMGALYRGEARAQALEQRPQPR